MEQLTKENFAEEFQQYIKEEGLRLAKVAKAIGCSITTLKRLLPERQTLPTEEMLKQARLMRKLGFETYCKLIESKKDNFAEVLGAISGGTLGLASVAAMLNSAESSAVLDEHKPNNIKKLGKITGGSGIGLAFGLPMAGLALGYSLIKGLRVYIDAQALNNTNFDPKWEILAKKS